MPTCPACGTKVKGKRRACPHCGWEFKRSEKFECPFCGELIPMDSQKCPLCGIDLSKLLAKARSQSVEKIREILLSDLKEIEASDKKEEKKKYSCPKCAELLFGSESKCPKCGQILIGKTGLKCPSCGTTVGKRRKTCPKCGMNVGDIGKNALPMVRVVSKEPAKKLVEPVPQQLVEPPVEFEEPRGPHTCPTCGAIVPEHLQQCPICETELIEGKPEPELPPAPQIQAEEIPIEPEPEIEPPMEEAPAEPEPTTSEKTTTIELGQKQGVRGLSNGISHVNGRGMTNGTGAVNGRAFSDGTGISNGLGPRKKERSLERSRRILRWRLLAVLVVIVIVIPLFIYISNPRETSEFSVDGDFSDWDGATTYGTKIFSSAPSSNITEWAVATEASDLYVYFRTQAAMMSSTEAESYYMFVDSDGSNETGYVLDALGAEYMLQLTGWNGSVDSSSLSRYSSTSDRLDWNSWSNVRSLSHAIDGAQIEVRASMPSLLGNEAKFLLLSKDSVERSAVSYAAPLDGAVLVVEQIPSYEVALDGLVPASPSVPLLTVRFTSEGGSGSVDEVVPQLVGAPAIGTVLPFSLDKGETKEMTVTVDTSFEADGELVAAEILASEIVSSYSSIEILGSGARAYVGSAPPVIAIDGAFADWAGRLSIDSDPIPVTPSNVNIDEVGNVSTSLQSFFYVSVQGDICSGTYVPAMVAKPSGTGGGVVIPTRHTAEDILSIYVDSDKNISTGALISIDSKEIGADQKIEVRGLFGMIISTTEFDYSSGSWVSNQASVKAAKDDKRIEIEVSAQSLGGSADIDFIVETTSWKGKADQAVFDPSSTRASTRTWIVDPTLNDPYATAMSYQRKMFYDGTNHWSFYFDGANTVHKYSVDEGQTWNYSGRVFVTSGVNETSIWYDASTSTVYAVGDISLASTRVVVQAGKVDVAAHTISWAAADSGVRVSTYALGGKNAFISKDLNGYLWVASSNCSQDRPARYQISVFRSASIGSASSWIDTGQLLPWASDYDNIKCSIVPAGSGSDMWAVYAFQGAVRAMKHTGFWLPESLIYGPAGSTANTDNSPPSVVIDRKGVVHVVYGTGRKAGQTSIPQIFYSHSNSDLTFTAGLNLDPANDSLGVANYYPTISLETSTDTLYVLWLQCDSAFTPKTVLARKCVSGTWNDVYVTPQTTFTKQYLTSIYSVSGESNICWQWTQNTSAPIQVLYDSFWVPEFSELTPFVLLSAMIFAVLITNSRRRRGLDEV